MSEGTTGSEAWSDLYVIVPAPLHYEGVPRLVLQRLDGRPLLRRVLTTARTVVESPAQVEVVTDSDEVALLAERSGHPARIVEGVRGGEERLSGLYHDFLSRSEKERGRPYRAAMLLRPYSPLIDPDDLRGAVRKLRGDEYDTILSATRDRRHSWRKVDGRYEPDFGSHDLAAEEDKDAVLRETGAFLLSRRSVVRTGRFTGERIGLATIPSDRALEIHSRREWWVCDRVLRRKRVVFVLIGYEEVGLGHVYRASMLAHELFDHEVHFLCTRESDLAARQLSNQPFPVHRQEEGQALAEAVRSLEPDVIVNDVLNTDGAYVRALKESGAVVINFEDLGGGATEADLVVNGIYEEGAPRERHLTGPRYFCIRDEFLQIDPAPFRESAREAIVTFGGTDPADLTRRVLDVALPVARERDVRLTVVTGPGYAYTEELSSYLKDVPDESVVWAHATNRISDYMARADVGFSSAGRTVFELAAMRVPSIIVAANQRQDDYTWASEELGMRYLGPHDTVSDREIAEAFRTLLDSPRERRGLREAAGEWGFRHGRQRVLSAMERVIEERS